MPNLAPRPLGDLNAAMRDLDMSADQAQVLLDGGKPALAVLSRPSGASAFAPPLRARIGLLLGRTNDRIPAIVTYAIQNQAEFTRRQTAASAQAAQLAEAVQQAEALAEAENLSQRKLAAKLGLCPRTWRRIRSLKVNPADWLPKIRSAIPRLKPVLACS